jgi:hypothetical protein
VRRTGYWLAFGAAAAALAVTGWPGRSPGPATWITRVDVIAAPALVVAAGWVARRVCGPLGGGRLARGVRAGGYLCVFALLLVKAQVERFEYVAWRGSGWLTGLWTGEILFLVAVAAYVAGLTAVTARRAPASPAALAVGTAAGVASGLVMLALPPAGNPLHAPAADLTVLHGLGRGVAIPLVLGGAIAAGLVTARRASDRGSVLPLSAVRARQGVAAGLCAGAVAALLISLAGLGAALLLAHRAGPFPLPLPYAQHVPRSVVAFEVSLEASAAGYLLPLVFFPVLGAGLGAWGGMVGGQPAPGNGGGGGGGPDEPAPPPPPPGGRSEEPEDQHELQLAGVGSGAGSATS